MRYESSDAGWAAFEPLIRRLVVDRGLRDICEVGGGANPLLTLDYVTEKGLTYTVLDVSAEELAKAPSGYTQLLMDAADSNLVIHDRFDLVFSRMVAEHVRNGLRFHQNVHQMLRPGGFAIHFFPTLYAWPFLLNRLTPEWVARPILRLVAPSHLAGRGKFPAYYSWCRGPSAGMIRRLEAIGYEIIEYCGYFGHHGYYQRLPVLKGIHASLTTVLVRHPIPLLTSYALTILRKPNPPLTVAPAPTSW